MTKLIAKAISGHLVFWSLPLAVQTFQVDLFLFARLLKYFPKSFALTYSPAVLGIEQPTLGVILIAKTVYNSVTNYS